MTIKSTVARFGAIKEGWLSGTGASLNENSDVWESVGAISAEPLAQRKSSIKRFMMVIFGFLACVGWVESASATIIFNNDRTGFEASLNSLITDDYENPGYVLFQNDATMSSVIGETAYTSTGFADFNLVLDQFGVIYYCAGCNGSFLLDFTSTSIGSASGVDGVGFNIFNRSSLYNAFVTFGDNSTSNFALPVNFFTTPLTDFWGITSELKIKTIHIGLADGESTTSGNFGIDNLTIGASPNPVPEPATLILFGLGLAGLGFARRKRAA